MNLHYIIGDATEPVKRPAMICHCCNDEGGWGRGFVLALSKKWPTPEAAYREWFRLTKALMPDVLLLQLGNVQFVHVAKDIEVVNIIGQHGTQWNGKIPPIRYDAIEKGLKEVYARAIEPSSMASGVKDYTVHMPRIGAVLAGGNWPTIEKIILSTMTVDTYVYTLESQRDRWPTKYETI